MTGVIFVPKRWLLSLALALILISGGGASAADLIGNCEMSGPKGEEVLVDPATPGSLTVGTSLPEPTFWNGDRPESIKDGFEYCLAASIAWGLGLDQVRIVDVSWGDMISGRASGFDLALSETPSTAGAKRGTEQSVPYFNLDLGVLAKSGSTMVERDMKRARVGVQQETLAETFVAATLKPRSTLPFVSERALLAALRTGQIDAAITDLSIGLAEEVQSKGSFAVVGRYRTRQGYVALLPKGSHNKAVIDHLIDGLRQDGTLDRLASRYLYTVWGKDPSALGYFKP
jgi:polar amino acid transport system substrate-binding protein